MHLKFVSLAAVAIIALASPIWPQAITESPPQTEASGSPQPPSPQLEPPRDPGARRTEIEAGLSYESLSHGFAPWRRAYAQIVRHIAERKAVYVTIEGTERFARRDAQFTVGTYYPLGQRWTAVFEGTISPSHNILGKWSALGQLEHDLGSGWGTHAGFGHREFNTAQVNVVHLQLEKQIKPFRAAYTFYASHLERAGFATTHRVEANYYYGDSAVNLNVAYGQESENIPPAGILRTNVRLVSLGGLQWLNGGWGLSYAGSWHEQGRIYSRRGITLGIRRRL